MAGDKRFDPEKLAELDAKGYTVLEAITHAGRFATGTLARPNAFVAVDGNTYWVKGDSQQGLVAEGCSVKKLDGNRHFIEQTVSIHQRGVQR